MANKSYFQNDDLSFDELYDQAVASRPMLNDYGLNLLESLRGEYPGRFEATQSQIIVNTHARKSLLHPASCRIKNELHFQKAA